MPALMDAMDDADGEVQFHAAVALEAITGCKPPKRDDDSPGAFYRAIQDLVAVDPVHEDLVQNAKAFKKVIGLGPTLSVITCESDHAEPLRRWFEAAGRLGPDAPESARRIVRKALDIPLPPPVSFQPVEGKRHELETEPPELAAIRAAGWMRDTASVPLLTSRTFSTES